MGSGLLLIGQPVGYHDELLEGEVLRAQVAIYAKLGQLSVCDEVGEAVADGLATLATPFGVMEGSYTLQDESGQQFEAPIAPFTLAVPNIIN